ncbi:hypothetical protein Cgig2_026885 [Carnegiea gigantea]|uniref:YDG domain-containing protein n=1 Tax=Carnegiea gigantea TaxID=171969 RepID=A0A9Q1KUD2_9CARY|nr:hypothetical protein Cgig2_026885 [Carnegiea gigantea]
MRMDNFGNERPRFAFSREFPAGCGISSSSSSLMGCSRVKSVHNFTRDFPPGCGPNAEKITQMCPEKKLGSERISGSMAGIITKPPLSGKTLLKIPLKPKGKEAIGKIKPPLSDKLVKEDPQKVKGKEAVGLCSMGTLKNKNPLSDEMVPQNPRILKGNQPVDVVKNKPPLSHRLVKGKETVSSGEREKVLEMLRLFRNRCDEISWNEKGIKRADAKADAELQNEGQIVHQSALRIGPIPGVEVGDKFYYRVELMIVGLHRRPQAGIDSMEFGREKDRIATCIVANERHLDKMNDPNIIEKRLPIRLVRGLKFGVQKILYVYDGLYEVRHCDKQKGPQSNMIFVFQLFRCPEQPVIRWKDHI